MWRWLLGCLCLFALGAAAPACAQVYRCIGAQGEPVFSGEPCGTPAPRVSATGADGRFAGICAASPQALRRDIGKAFASHDVNLLAGLILWRGVDQADARNTLQSLTAWLQQPLVGVTVVYPTGPPDAGSGAQPASAASAAAPRPTGFQLATAADTRDFGLTELGGCWWLTF